MDIFLATYKNKEGIQIEKIKNKINENVKKTTIDLIEYAYLLDYIQSNMNQNLDIITTTSIINIKWFEEIINKINDIELTKMITSIFAKIFEISQENKLKIKNNNLIELIQEDRKETIIFTDDQKKAINLIVDYLPNHNLKTFGLYGYAGTGKTTTIVEIVYFLFKNKLINSVVLTAPTNKALNVIKSKFKGYLQDLYNIYFKKEASKYFSFNELVDCLKDCNIKIDFITIHQLLKFELDYNSNGELSFVRGNKQSLISQYELVIIDECSMIPMKIVEQLFIEIRYKVQKGSNKFNKTPKIIFLGDPAQLPPVSEKSSIIFTKEPKDFTIEDYIKISNIDCDDDKYFKSDTFTSKYNMLLNDLVNMQTFVLKKVMRSKHKSITKACYEIRLWTIGEKKTPDVYKYTKNGVCAYKLNKQDKIKTDWFKKFLKYCEDKNNCNIILTWTNKQADEYNNATRSYLFKDNKIKRFEIGDVLIMNDFYEINYEDNKDLEDKERIFTSEQIKVSSADIKKRNITRFSLGLSKNALKLKDSNMYEKHYKLFATDVNNIINADYTCWLLQVEKMNDETNKNSNFKINVMHESEINKWKFDKDYVFNAVIKLRNDLYKKFPTKKTTIEENVIKPIWREYHKNLSEPFADVNYGYAMTVHKSQGSNFYNVFVDIQDILKNNNQTEKRKCLYTAMTRAVNELNIIL